MSVVIVLSLASLNNKMKQLYATIPIASVTHSCNSFLVKAAAVS